MKRFYEKVRKIDGGCWHWMGALDQKGYGRIAMGSRRTGAQQSRRPWLAHRLSWVLHRGAIPDGLHVLHRCDNPICVNPEHLFLGTNSDNIADRVTKGRSHHQDQRGQLNYNAKLTVEQVQAIRGDPRSQRALALVYGISKSMVGYIKSGHSWEDWPT